MPIYQSLYLAHFKILNTHSMIKSLNYECFVYKKKTLNITISCQKIIKILEETNNVCTIYWVGRNSNNLFVKFELRYSFFFFVELQNYQRRLR